MPAGTSVAISDAAGSQAFIISKAGLRCSGNDLRPAVRPTMRNPDLCQPATTPLTTVLFVQMILTRSSAGRSVL